MGLDAQGATSARTVLLLIDLKQEQVHCMVQQCLAYRCERYPLVRSVEHRAFESVLKQGDAPDIAAARRNGIIAVVLVYM